MSELLLKKIKSLYDAGRITETHLDVAVSKGWITAAQKEEIMEVDDGTNG